MVDLLDVTLSGQPLALSWKCLPMHVACACRPLPSWGSAAVGVPPPVALAPDQRRRRADPLGRDSGRSRTARRGSGSLGIYCGVSARAGGRRRDRHGNWVSRAPRRQVGRTDSPAPHAGAYMNDRDNTRQRHIGRGPRHAPSCHADGRGPRRRRRAVDRPPSGAPIAHTAGTLSDPRCNLPRPAGGEWPRRGATVHRPRHPAAGVASSCVTYGSPGPRVGAWRTAGAGWASPSPSAYSRCRRPAVQVAARAMYVWLHRSEIALFALAIGDR